MQADTGPKFGGPLRSFDRTLHAPLIRGLTASATSESTSSYRNFSASDNRMQLPATERARSSQGKGQDGPRERGGSELDLWDGRPTHKKVSQKGLFMKTPHALSHSLLILITGLAACIVPVPILAEEFTLQGRLTLEGQAVEGLHDFHLEIRTWGGEGEPLAVVETPAVLISDGVFTLPVEFFGPGSDPFHGYPLGVWVSIRPTEAASAGLPGRPAATAAPGPGFVTLQPPLRLSRTPSATTALLASRLSGIAPGASGVVSLQPGGGFTVTPGPSPAWLLQGNTGTGVPDFLGTTDPSPLELRVNGVRALRVEPTVGAANLIGGFAGNEAPGVIGGVIAGGGAAAETNRLTASHSFIGGGRSNQVDGALSVIGGGVGNRITQGNSVIGGGRLNVADGAATSVGGGDGNRATGSGATVGGGTFGVADGAGAVLGGGEFNQANGSASTVSGGSGNMAVGTGTTIGGGIGNRSELDLATVGGGGENLARHQGATVAGGVGNQADNLLATVGGGGANFAMAPYSTIPGGTGARTTGFGQVAQSSGVFSDTGDAQTSVFTLRALTVDNSQPLSLDGAGAQLTLPRGNSLTFVALVIARSQPPPSSPAGTYSAGYRVRGVAADDGGGIRFVGTPVVEELGEDLPAWSVTPLVLGDRLIFEVASPGLLDPVRWSARLETVEVTWPTPPSP